MFSLCCDPCGGSSRKTGATLAAGLAGEAERGDAGRRGDEGGAELPPLPPLAGCGTMETGTTSSSAMIHRPWRTESDLDRAGVMPALQLLAFPKYGPRGILSRARGRIKGKRDGNL